MKRILPLVLGLITLSFASQAGIVYQNFIPNKVLKLNDPTLSFDLDGDATDDINFNLTGSNSNYNLTVDGPALEFARGSGNHSGYPELLFIAKIIDGNKNWGNLGATETIASTSGRDLAGAKEFFIGVRFKSGSNYFYGWILMEFKSNYELNIKSVAFETIFNSYILVGNTGSSLIGQAEYKAHNNWELYPSLVKDQLNIDSEELIKSISIYNIQGQALKHYELHSNSAQLLDLADLRSGTYLLEARDHKGGIFRDRFIKP